MRYTYTGIEVRDLDRSIAFYRDVLGMEYLGRHEIEATGGEVAALRSKGAEHVLELNWYPNSRYREGSELDHLAFECEDVEKTGRPSRSLNRPRVIGRATGEPRCLITSAL